MSPEEDKKIDQLVQSINDVAQTARTLLLGLLVVALTMGALVVGTTDAEMLRDSAEIAPTLGVRVSVLVAHLFAPIVFLFLHVSALIQLDLLIQRVGALDTALANMAADDDVRRHCRQRLMGFPFVQLLVGGEAQGVARFLLRAVAWLSYFLIPLLLLLAVQIGFVRYQSRIITGVHQGVILIDVLVVAWFHWRLYGWPRLTWADTLGGAADPIDGLCRIVYGARWSWRRVRRGDDHARAAFLNATIVAVVAWLSVFAHPPDAGLPPLDVRWEETDVYKASSGRNTTPRYFEDAKSACSTWTLKEDRDKGRVYLYASRFAMPLLRLCNPLDFVLCPWFRPWGCRYLQLNNLTLISREAPPQFLEGIVDKGAALTEVRLRVVGLHLQDRSLRFANFVNAMMFGVDLTRADLRNANLEDASLQDAWLDNALLRGAGLDSANLENASVGQANLEGATVRDTWLAGAHLRKAKLAGAVLSRSMLAGARLDGADLRGAWLKAANLQGASIVGAKLLGASFKGANLQATLLAGGYEAEDGSISSVSCEDQ